MINDHRKLSESGFKLLKSIEKLVLRPYDDQTGKPIRQWCRGATIGYGHLIQAKEWDVYRFGITPHEAESLFMDDLFPFEHHVRLAIINPLSQQQYDALVIFAFNIGVRAFVGSSVVKLINDPAAVTKFVTLESAWRAWNKSDGMENEGLNNRRNCEWNIWTSGKYAKW